MNTPANPSVNIPIQKSRIHCSKWISPVIGRISSLNSSTALYEPLISRYKHANTTTTTFPTTFFIITPHFLIGVHVATRPSGTKKDLLIASRSKSKPPGLIPPVLDFTKRNRGCPETDTKRNHKKQIYFSKPVSHMQKKFY